jgi:MSHA biogenesis protein MshP
MKARHLVQHRFQQGFAAIAAIFLVVVLAALGAFMVTFSNTQQLTSAQDVQGSRAYWAARAGLEWGISSVNATPVCPASPTILTVDSFSVVVTCSLQTYSEGGATRNIFQFTSVAGSAGGVGSAGFIERSVSASMEL